MTSVLRMLACLCLCVWLYVWGVYAADDVVIVIDAVAMLLAAVVGDPAYVV